MLIFLNKSASYFNAWQPVHVSDKRLLEGTTKAAPYVFPKQKSNPETHYYFCSNGVFPTP